MLVHLDCQELLDLMVMLVCITEYIIFIFVYIREFSIVGLPVS
jgi:hypothetical protein